MKVAVIGVGAMGLAMAGHIKQAGHDVVVTDIDAQRRAEAEKNDLTTVETLAEAAQNAEVFIIVVVTDDQSRTVTRDILKTGRPGAAIVIAATNNLRTMQALAGQAETKGFRFVDAPVVFGLKGAIDGELVSLCGGSVDDVAFVEPVLMAYGRAIHHVGPVGAGQLAKTCNNMMHLVACVANYEVLLLAKRFGVNAQKMREILLDCPAHNVTLKRWDSTRFTWHEKDMDVALDLAQDGGVPLPLFGQVDQLVKRLGPEQVKELLYGEEAEYLGETIVPLDAEHGGLG